MADSGGSTEALVAALERLRPSDHLCVPYEEHEDRFLITGHFVRMGLERGHRCVFIPETDAGPGLLGALQSDGVDVGAAQRSGALTIVDKEDSYLRDGRFDPDRMLDWIRALAGESRARGFPVLRFLGEAVSIFKDIPGMDRFAEYESRLNPLVSELPILVLCLYNHHRFPHDIVRQVLQTHPLVVYGRTVCENPFYLRPVDFLAPDWPSREVEWMLRSLVELQRAHGAVRESAERYRDLVRHLLEVQEGERRALARELHDQMGQALVAIRLTLLGLRDASPAAASQAQQGVTIVDDTLAQVRRLAFELRPSTLDDLGLSGALRRLVEAHAERGGYEVRFTATPPDARFPGPVETASFRIAQEALTNVDQHAGARHVEVTLTSDARELRLVIQDDGVGFDVAQHLGKGLGLVGMHERAAVAGGTIEARSAPGRGTTIEVRLPLE